MRNHLFGYLQQYPEKKLIIRLAIFSSLMMLFAVVNDHYDLHYWITFIVGSLLVWPGLSFVMLVFYAKLSGKDSAQPENKMLRILAGILFLLVSLSPFLYLWALKATT